MTPDLKPASRKTPYIRPLLAGLFMLTLLPGVPAVAANVDNREVLRTKMTDALQDYLSARRSRSPATGWWGSPLPNLASIATATRVSRAPRSACARSAK